ncbi:hypothetical protein Hanom_Chr03g00220821 [Helianthus anomalus]
MTTAIGAPKQLSSTTTTVDLCFGKLQAPLKLADKKIIVNNGVLFFFLRASELIMRN